MLLLALVTLLLSAPLPAPDTAAVQAAAEAALAARFPDDAYRLAVRVVRTGGEADDGGRVRVAFGGPTGLPSGHVQVKVLSGSDDKGWAETGWAVLYVAHYDSVAVARADVRKDDPVAPTDLSIAWIETTRFPGQPLRAADVRALESQGELFAARPLRQGRPLQAGDLRTAYAAVTGDAVLVHYRRGTFELRLSCKAREPGFVGDAIRVYSPDTRTNYRARLTGPGTAEWMETL